jgi:hypothetical protein
MMMTAKTGMSACARTEVACPEAAGPARNATAIAIANPVKLRPLPLELFIVSLP